MHHWKVRDGDEKDLKEILSLREIVFGELEKDKLEERFWRWEYEQGPDGRAFLYIVEEGKRCIGHLADLPRQFSVNGEGVPGTFHLELMVHPDYWRRGIFYEMEKYAVQHVKHENKLLMTACTVRQESINGLKKAGWKPVCQLPVLVFPIRFRGILNRYLHFQPLSLLIGGVARFFYFLLYGLKRREETGGVEIEKVGQLDDTFDTFWQKALSLHSIIGIRNRNYLTWRYLRHPTRNYTIYRAKKNGEMIGYIVLRKVELLQFNSTVIVDLLALDEVTLYALVQRGIQHSQRERADLLGVIVPQVHFYYRLLRKMGFLRSFKIFQFLVYSHWKEGVVFTPKKWYVTWGDTDVM
jgi:GNAT superfamily N-acetyltransferase